MKTTITRFAITIACFLTLVSSCKKDDPDPEPEPIVIPPPPVATDYFILHDQKYVVYDMLTETSSQSNEYTLYTWSTYQGDTLKAIIRFNTDSPSEGAHSTDTTGTDAFMVFKNHTEQGYSESGTCTILNVDGQYKFTFTDVYFRDQTSHNLVKVTGVALAP